MSHAFRRFVVGATGGPEQLEWVQDARQELAPGEVAVRTEAVGVDFIDAMIRSGRLPSPLPTGIGYSAVGIVDAIGAEVIDVAVGDRVAYVYFVPGSYAEYRHVPAERIFRLPDQTMSPVIAAGAMFRGLTAWYLVNELWELKPGDTALVHAAAGGVGLILLQWLRYRGVMVVGTVRERGQVPVLLEYGCHATVVMPDEDLVGKVRQATRGKGADVVYESIGAATFERSLECARRFGLIVSYGWPSGDPEVSLMTLRAKGSLFLTRPTISHYVEDPSDYRRGAAALFRLVGEGVLRIHAEHTYPLREAAQAHADMESGRTVGSVVLVA